MCVKKIAIVFFLLPIFGRDNIVLRKIFEMEILKNLHVFKSLKSENHIFSVWFVRVCVSLMNITSKQNVICRCYFFYEDRTNNLCTAVPKRTAMHYEQRTEFLIRVL